MPGEKKIAVEHGVAIILCLDYYADFERLL